MLDHRRWPEADSLLDRALDEPPARRSAFLAREVHDPELAKELGAVLAEAERADDFLRPCGAISGPLFGDFAAAIDDDAPALEEGRTLGPYRVGQRIGRGGMGEVFRARDLRLGRDVALKVLPAGVASDATRLARVEREARTLAALSHPNIASIHDLYDEPLHEGPLSDARRLVALVLELVEGPTLAERLARGPLPVEIVVAIARQLVEAIAAAHERGIVHRDLKPANIKVTPDGVVKVLDFGLARVVSSAADEFEPATGAPSITTAVHGPGPGLVMGTTAYMSPEQARGQRVDHRTDIWAFGCVLYEMLAGRRAFEGETASDVMARVIEREPDYARLPAAAPPPLVRLVRRCLRKDPSRRLGFIGDARLDLEEQELTAARESAAAVRASAPRTSGRVMLVAAAALAVGVIAGVLLMRARPVSAPTIARLAVPLPAGHDLIVGQAPALARSADGRTLVYRARHDGVMRLFVRSLGDAQPRPLAGTENAIGHAVSPDGRSVAFGRDGRLFRLALSGGTPLPICDAPGGASLDWGPGGLIVFDSVTSRHLMRVDAAGGTPVALTALDTARGDTDHTAPDISPDGRFVAFTIAAGDGLRLAIASTTTAGGDGDVRLLGDGRQPRFLGNDLLLFARQRSVWAVRIDPRRGVVQGDAVQVLDADDVAQTGLNGYVHFAPADEGSLIYLGQSRTEPRQALVWRDRSGAELSTEYEGRGITRYAIAPDGSRIAFSSAEPEGRDIWVFDRARRTRGRLTMNPASDTAPVWSPDGRRVAFRSDRDGGGIFLRAADGADEERRLTNAAGLYHTPYAFTPDGTRLLFVELKDYKQQDVLSVTLDSQPQSQSQPQQQLRVERVLAGPYAELRPALSPDGRWLAYQSDESGRFEVYVRPFPDVQRAKWQVSVDGGTSPLWRADGRELFFATGGLLAAVDVAVPPAASGALSTPSTLGTPGAPGAAFGVGAVRRLFALSGGDERLGPIFDIQPDGTRVLVLREHESDAPAPAVHLIQSWDSLVRAALARAGE